MPETHQARVRPLADLLLEIKDDLLHFVDTRIRMFHAEFEGTARSLKRWIPLAITAFVLLGTAYLVGIAGLVALVSFAFAHSPYRWPFAFLTVGALGLIAGLIVAGVARNKFRSRGTFPKKTIEVLREDGLWLQDEVKHAA